MKALKNMALAAVLMIIAAPAMVVSAQGPLHKRVNFSVNVPFRLDDRGVILPAGNYVLFQVLQNDLNLFALYRENLMHSPIAMVRTSRIDYQPGEYPDDTEMLLDSDIESDRTLPVIEGWTIPGMDGWEIIAVVPDRDRIRASGYVVSSKANRKKGRVIITATSSGF
jgi:hypothetical protein